MAKKHTEFDDYAESFGDDALEELESLLEDFPELDEYLDDILDLDDGDFYHGFKNLE